MKKNLTANKHRNTLETVMADLTLGKMLRAFRGERSLRTVAAECSISHSLLAQIENEEIALPRRETLAALARYYDVPLETLARVAYCGGRPVTEPVAVGT